MLPLGFLSELKLPKRAPEQKNQCDRLIESVDLERFFTIQLKPVLIVWPCSHIAMKELGSSFH